MATFNHISGAEPSTITFKLATITQTRNSSVMHQEILALGDPDTSNAIAAVLNAVPASSAWGLATRPVGAVSIQGNSTVIQGTSPWVIAGDSTVAPLAGSTWATRPVQSSAADLQMTATQGTSPWIIAGNSSVAQASSNWQVQVTNQVRVSNSTAADLTVTVAGYSTTVNVSSLGGVVSVSPNSTAWVKSAGFSVDSSNYLNVNASVTASTTVNVSSVSGLVTVIGSTAAASSAYVAVRVTNGSAFQDPVTDYTANSSFTLSTVTGNPFFLRASSAAPTASTASDLWQVPWGSLNGALYTVLATDSGASAMDSTNSALKVNVVAGAAGGSTIVTISTVQGVVTTSPNSTAWVKNAGFSVDSSNYLNVNASVTTSTTVNVSSVSGVVATNPNSTAWVKNAGFSVDSSNYLNVNASVTTSTTVNVSSLAGTVAVSPASSAAAAFFPVRLSDGSTLLNPAIDYTHDGALTWSTVTGGVTMARASSALPAAVSADDDVVALWASLNGALNVILRDSTGGALAASTSPPSSNVNALAVRPVIQPSATPFVGSTFFVDSTVYTIVSSNAASAGNVYAYSITSTETTARTVGFYRGSTLLWNVTLQAPSSGISGANSPGCSPPAYLFRGSTGKPLTVQISGSTGPAFAISVAYFVST